MIHRSRGPGRISRKVEEMRGWKERFAWRHGKERPCFTQQLVGRSSRHLQKSIPRRWREGSRPKAEGSAWGNGPSLRAEHRAIVRAPKPEEKKHWRNIGIFERGSRNWHPRSRRQSIFQEENQPRVAVGEERRGGSRREGGRGRERVARKMTINNWYNAARPSFRRRRRRAPLPLPVCLSVCLCAALIVIAKKVEEERTAAASQKGNALGHRPQKGKCDRRSPSRRPLRHHHIVSLHALMASGLKMNPPPTRCCLRRDRSEVAWAPWAEKRPCSAPGIAKPASGAAAQPARCRNNIPVAISCL